VKLSKALSARERDELESLMESRSPDGAMGASITRLHGFLTNIVSGPPVRPSEWIPQVFDGPDERAWETIEQARGAMGLLMRFYNEVVANLRREDDRFAVMIDRIGEGADALDLVDDWARGYVHGIALRRNEWKVALDDEELSPCFDPIYTLADFGDRCPDPIDEPKAYQGLVHQVPDCVVEIYEWWRDRFEEDAHVYGKPVRRVQPKISPNAPCPCGSGRKYKRCCSPLRALP